MAREAKSVKNLFWNLSHRVLVMAANISITNLTVLVIGHWCMHIRKTYWHRVGHIHHNQLVEILKMSFRGHRKAMTLTHNLCIQVISKAVLQISSFSAYHLYLKHFPTWQNYLGFLWTGWWGGWNICEGVEREAVRWQHSEPLLAPVKAFLVLCHMYTKFHWVLICDHLSKDMKFLNTKHFV